MTDRRRRQKEQRAAKKQQEKKHKARRELGRRLVIALGFGVLVIAIFAAGSLFGSGNEALPPTYLAYRDKPTACDADQPPEQRLLEFEAPEQQTDLGSGMTATIETSCGDVVIALDAEGFPRTVESFVFLARAGFYDGQVFHRVAADFLIQGGDPAADGSGGPGYTVEDEYPDEEFVYSEGTVAMANAGKGTTGSQFFIVVGPNAAALNPQFNVLGTVVSGMETLLRISAVPVGTRPESRERSLPLETVYIDSITIEPGS